MSSHESPETSGSIGHDRLVRFLAGHGWEVSRRAGRHTILEKDDTEVAVPYRLSLKSTTIAAILRFIGIPREEWSRL